ncbi:FecCD family ABC transporter permease [Paracoccus shanxieyensis]|uniref:Iron chelate uptake ABC transporter family permease subunit n=1 Tax=Paracoccus shanxieyensis TaxID=2675752 RepID=A0A6L6IUJ6_9RHOB|nr:iron ABC transporter permease [Paracoccus shanxieyensis]MTH62982.1 iron chelate uptake ABC transporter family permease subunit [Paracoccus shanxieyensis]MTH85934.1 iron chelate uptake ABC transporter family permease subunit [Paracoccus shanxieyensis]
MNDILASYHAQGRRHAALVAVLALAALAALVLDLTTGPAGLPLGETLRALAGAEVSRGTQVIVWDVRLPVAVMALLVGAALALAGAEMQTVLENPLAEPFTLGVSASAALGAAVAIVLGLTVPGLPPVWAVSANAFIFAVGALMLLQLLGRLRGGGPEVLILFGVALNFTAAALLSLVQFVASADALQQLVFWSMGSLAATQWPGVAMVAVVLALAVPFSFRAAWKLTALRLGEDQAQSFGVDVTALRRWTLLRVGVLSAAAVSMVGVIGFVGLAGPHIARLLVGENHRVFLPASILTGALVMSLASTLSKTIVPGVLLPIGLVTSLIGLPIFFALILRGRRR